MIGEDAPDHPRGAPGTPTLEQIRLAFSRRRVDVEHVPREDDLEGRAIAGGPQDGGVDRHREAGVQIVRPTG